jgi:hypothetical protein
MNHITERGVIVAARGFIVRGYFGSPRDLAVAIGDREADRACFVGERVVRLPRRMVRRAAEAAAGGRIMPWILERVNGGRERS